MSVVEVLSPPRREVALGKRKENSSDVVNLLGSLASLVTNMSCDKRASSSSMRGSQTTTTLLVGSGRKTLRCTWAGCTKLYAKACRLEEHMRSHTGERPFSCAECSKTFLRDTHLHAHMRSHQPPEERSFECSRLGCGKQFWTRQHLETHELVHQGDTSFKCETDGCAAAFRKHHQLRTHIAEVHCPEGTKPFRCLHEGCAKSFPTSQKLRTHSKVHQDDRYVCSELTCSSTATVSFPNWTALQAHIRSAHPPTCPYAECNGRIFSSAKNLKPHLKMHIDRERELEVDRALVVEEGNEGEAEGEDCSEVGRVRKKRRGGEFGRGWKCIEEGCDKAFKSPKALTNHQKINHEGQRKFVCSYAGCSKTFGYKHVLQRHLARHGAPARGTHEDDAVALELSAVQYITGEHYTAQASAATREKKLLCPWPDGLQEGGTKSGAAQCGFMFGRVYDLRRHLKADHGFEAENELLKAWAAKFK